MHVDDITFAMNSGYYRGHLSELESAFRALVLYPSKNEIQGLMTVTQAVDLLNRVAAVLEEDTRNMPGHVVEFIRSECAGSMTASTYSSGSRTVREHMVRWRAHFALSLPPGNLEEPPQTAPL